MLLPVGLGNLYFPLIIGSHFKLEPEFGLLRVSEKTRGDSSSSVPFRAEREHPDHQCAHNVAVVFLAAGTLTKKQATARIDIHIEELPGGAVQEALG